MTEEIWSRGNLELIDELYAADFRCHAEPGEDRIGREAVKAWVTEVRASYPDYEERIDELIAEGDKVVVRMTASGTNTGNSPIGTPPTGRFLCTMGILVYRLADGRIAEQWEVNNVAGELRQLGLSSE